MKVLELINELALINPNYDVMIKVGDSERDLITKVRKIYCVNPKINPAIGYIELETCNAIDWRGVHKEDENKSKLQKLKAQLSTAGDRRDWDECERLEKEIEELSEKHCGDCKYIDHKKSEPPCNSCDLTFSNYMDKNKKVKIDFDINDLTKGE